MSVGIGMKGLEVEAVVGGLTLLGQTTKGITCNNEALDTTTDDSSGWQERLATPGVKSIEFAVSGTFQNLELLAAFVDDSSQIYVVAVTYPDGSVLTMDMFLDSFSHTGESNGLHTYDASFSSSGVPVFVAGT